MSRIRKAPEGSPAARGDHSKDLIVTCVGGVVDVEFPPNYQGPRVFVRDYDIDCTEDTDVVAIEEQQA